MSSRHPDSLEVPQMDSKELLRLFIEYTPVAVALCDRKMRYLAHSRRWVTDFGLTQENLTGLCHYDVFPEIPEKWKLEHQRCLSGEIIKKEEEPFPRTDGSIDWVRRELHPWRDPNGRIGGLIMFAEVITERKNAQEALKKSEEKFSRLFHANPHGITLSTLEEGRYLEVNETFLKQTGWNREDLIGHTSMEVGLWANPANRKEAKRILENTGHLTGLEVTFRKKTGELFQCIWSAEVVEVEGTTCILSVVTDISERKRMEQALKESEEKYRIIFENANDAIFVAQDGVVKFANPSTLKLVNTTLEELSSTDFLEFVHPDDREQIAENHRRRLRGEKLPETYTFRIIRKPNEVRTVQISAVLTQWEGRPATLNFLRDVTEQKRLETQLHQSQRLEAIGTLAGGVAHDFNNLLMGIQGNVSLMLMDLDHGHPHVERLQSIQEQVRKGAELTKQLLGFARGGKYEVKPTNLNQLVQASCELFNRTKKEIKIYEKYEHNLWVSEVDRTQIEQVLLNLFVNAWQAMPGGGELYVETQNVTLYDSYAAIHGAKPGKYVKISVTDTGIGMDEETRKKVFDPFFTTKEMGRGTGLGLASAYGIIKNHGGFINVYSELGKGSTFNIYLPASDQEIKEEPMLTKEILTGHETILLVDDEKTVLNVGKRMLEMLGYNVFEATGGQEAIEIFEHHKDEIHLVILDMVLPHMGGGEVFDALKKIDPKVKVLLSSGYSLNGHAKEILARGCNGFIQKPFDVETLSQKIREILGY